MIDSITLDAILVRAIGRQLLNFDLSPFLKIGLIKACFQLVGNKPDVNEDENIIDKGMDKDRFNECQKRPGRPSGPPADEALTFRKNFDTERRLKSGWFISV